MLALLGELYADNPLPPSLSFSLGLFLFGIFISGLANLTAYLTQLALYNEQSKPREFGGEEVFFKKHKFWAVFIHFFVFVSIVCFAIGAWTGVNSLLDVPLSECV